jgi:hypothetical protein
MSDKRIRTKVLHAVSNLSVKEGFKKPITVDEIVAKIDSLGEPLLTRKQIYGGLNSAAKLGLIERVDKGLYRWISEDYVLPPIQKAKKEKETVEIFSLDSLKETLEEFNELMQGVFAALEYTKELESAVKFWSEEAKKQGVRWGAVKA